MYDDAQIAENRYWKRRTKFTGINTGIYSRDVLLRFSECQLFYGKAGVKNGCGTFGCGRELTEVECERNQIQKSFLGMIFDAIILAEDQNI